MPVQPSISPEQIITIVVFILMLIAVMWFIRRHKGGIASKLHASRRMVHVEDLSLAPQQRLHLIEGGWSQLPCSCWQGPCGRVHAC
jgi:flagellar biogenesis protein FliO